MTFIEDWKAKFPKLWSIRLSLLAGVASGIESGYQAWITGQPPIAATAAFFLAIGAAFARIVAQPSVTGNGSGNN